MRRTASTAVYRACYDFVNDLSSVYMDVAKDRLYSEAPASPRRRAVQSVLANVLEVLVRVLAPVLSFTTDEVWECYPAGMRAEGRPDNVQLAGWPPPRGLPPGAARGRGGRGRALRAGACRPRDGHQGARGRARGRKELSKSQEAKVVLHAAPKDLARLEEFGADVLAELFIVSGVEFSAEGEGAELSAEVLPADGEKCPRCWNYRELGGNPRHADVCERCGDVLDAIGFPGAEA